MAYNGYLIKIGGDYNVPLNLMNLASYKCTLSTLDKDSYRDGYGVLHRNAILQVPHCSFSTRQISNTELGELWANIRSRYTSDIEKKITASVYIPEMDSYYTGSFYIPDTDSTIHHIEGTTVRRPSLDHNAVTYNDESKINTQYKPTGTSQGYRIIYNPVTFEFIGYGEA